MHPSCSSFNGGGFPLLTVPPDFPFFSASSCRFFSRALRLSSWIRNCSFSWTWKKRSSQFYSLHLGTLDWEIKKDELMASLNKCRFWSTQKFVTEKSSQRMSQSDRKREDFGSSVLGWENVCEHATSRVAFVQLIGWERTASCCSYCCFVERQIIWELELSRLWKNWLEFDSDVFYRSQARENSIALFSTFTLPGRPSLSQRSITWGSATVQPRFQLNAFQLQSQPQRSPLGTIEDQMERGGYIKICVHLFLFTFLAVASWSQKVLNKDNNSCNFNLPSSSQKYWASRFVRSFISVMPLSSSLAFFVAA